MNNEKMKYIRSGLNRIQIVASRISDLHHDGKLTSEIMSRLNMTTEEDKQFIYKVKDSVRNQKFNELIESLK